MSRQLEKLKQTEKEEEYERLDFPGGKARRNDQVARKTIDRRRRNSWTRSAAAKGKVTNAHGKE